MSKKFLGILAVADSKDQVVAAYSAAATGTDVAFMSSTSGTFAVNGAVAFDPLGDGQLQNVSLSGDAKVEYAKDGEAVEANLSICTDGCQRFILSDSALVRCPSCSAVLTATEGEIEDMVFGSQSAADFEEPLFCGTAEQAAAFTAALRTGTVPSLSGELPTLKFDPFTGKEQERECSVSNAFVGDFFKYECAAGCSHPVTLSASTDVVFCAHCCAPLSEEKSEMKIIGRVENRLHVMASSLSAAITGLRAMAIEGGKAVLHNGNDEDALFISNSNCAFSPYVGVKVAGSPVMESLSADGDTKLDAMEIDVHKCSAGCGFMACSSDDAVFCSQCGEPLEEVDEADLGDLPEFASVDEEGEGSDVLDELDSDLAELEDEDLGSESSDEDLDAIDEEELDLDLDDSEESLSEDDFDDEDEESEEFEDDEEEDDEEEEDEDDLDEPSTDLDLESTSGDDEDENPLIEDDEVDEIDYEGEEEDFESESGAFVEVSLSAAEALEHSGEDVDALSVSTVFNGNDRWHAFYNGNVPLGSLTFAGLSNAVGEVAAKKLFNSALPGAVTAAVRENGLVAALSGLGFESPTLTVNVPEVVRVRSESAAQERVDRIQSEIDALGDSYRERYCASLSTAMLGVARRFWQGVNNPIGDALVNRIAAAGVSLSDARSMVTSAFAEHGQDFAANVFERADYLVGLSADGQNEISTAIEEMNAAAVTADAPAPGNIGTVARPAPTTTAVQETEVVASQSSAGDDFNSRLGRYFNQ